MSPGVETEWLRGRGIRTLSRATRKRTRWITGDKAPLKSNSVQVTVKPLETYQSLLAANFISFTTCLSIEKTKMSRIGKAVTFVLTYEAFTSKVFVDADGPR